MVKEVYKSHSFARKLQRKKWRKKYEDQIKRNQKCKILVVLHLFYPKSWKEIREYLKNLDCYDFDLIVTVTEGRIPEETLENVRAFHKNTTVQIYPNEGWDLLPFLRAIESVDLNEYDLVCKLQSKSTKRSHLFIYDQLFLRRTWFLNLYDGILSAKNVHQTVDWLFNDQRCGLVASQNLIVRDPEHKRRMTVKMAKERGLSVPENYHFVAGTCFMMKRECLQAALKAGFSAADFQTEQNLVTRGLSFGHFLERYLCASVEEQGYEFKGNKTKRFSQILCKPLEKLFQKLSAERLHKIMEFDPEWFYWQLDNRLLLWKYKKMRVGDLIVASPQTDKGGYIVKLTENAPYRYLTGDQQIYEKYARLHEKYGMPLMTKERFDALFASIKSNGYQEKSVILVDENGVIIDGQHRACCLCFLQGEDREINVVQIRILNKKGLLKLVIPKFLLKKIFQKKMKNAANIEDVLNQEI